VVVTCVWESARTPTVLSPARALAATGCPMISAPVTVTVILMRIAIIIIVVVIIIIFIKSYQNVTYTLLSNSL